LQTAFRHAIIRALSTIYYWRRAATAPGDVFRETGSCRGSPDAAGGPRFLAEAAMRSISRGRSHVLLSTLVLAVALHAGASAQVGQNINVITGSDSQFTGDMFRQRQNESVGGISSVNTSHIMVAYNDYRTVDYLEDAGAVVPPSLINAAFEKLLRVLSWPLRMARGRTIAPENEEAEGAAAAQAFIGLSFSDNGGKDWYTGLHPGHHSLPAATGAETWDQSEVLRGYEAASDPVMATTDRQFFVGGIAFNPGGGSVGFVSRFTDRNNTEIGQNIHFDGTKILLTQPSSRFFVDKPSIAAALGPNGSTYVYAAFVVFDQSDPLTSKIQLFRSTDAGVTWTAGSAVSEPLTRNQSPWLVIDPNDARTMYIGWRVFSARPGGLANAIVGKKSTNGGASFTTSLPYPVALLLKPFDQPQGDLRNGSLPIPRSNAYPTAAIDGNGVIHVALQEYVYPPTYPLAALRGLPLAPGVSVSQGVPRITVTSSANGGAFWTLRTAVDLANGAGSQFMPVIAAVGEPGPSCPGNAGRPRSRVMVMYYDARNGGIGVKSGGNGYVAGGNRQFDVRLAEASACVSDGFGRLVFGTSQQLSRYSLSSTPPHGILQTPGYGYTAVNRGYGIFCGGYCAFSGDYIHMSPRQPYVQTATGWKPTTARGVDQNTLPAPIVQGFWADTRNVILPTTPAPTLPPTQAGFIDSLPFWNYQSPGSGKPPGACSNAGSRDQNVYSAEYSPSNLFAGAPITFRRDNIPHAYPLFVENRAGVLRFFRLTIRSTQASFDYRSFDRTLPAPPAPDTEADIAIGPYSSVTGSVVVDAGAVGPIRVSVEELARSVVNGVVTSNGAILAGGAKTSVTLVTAGDTEVTSTETHTPVVAAVPIVTRPFAGQLDPQHPVAMTPFTQQPFTQQPSILNPFTQQPFTQQTSVYDVIDLTFPVSLSGQQAAAASALLAIQNAQQMIGNYLFQVIIGRVSLTPATNGCSSVDVTQELQVSNIRAPFTQQPFTQQPFTQQPFTQQPFTQQPFTQQPFTQQPFTQQSDPRDPVVSTSTFYLAPSPTSNQTAQLRDRRGPGADRIAAQAGSAVRYTPVGLQAAQGPNDYRASRADLGLTYTLRAFQIALNPPVKIFDPVTGVANVGVVVTADTPEIILVNGVPTFDPAGPPSSGGGAGVPVKLAVIQQPVAAGPGQTLAPVRVAVQDAFGATLTNLPSTAITIALGNNPTGATLGGTLTATTTAGVATFGNLSIDRAGAGYTLVATSGALATVTSEPFAIAADALTIVTTALPEGTVGAPYSQNAAAKGGVQPYVWDIEPIPGQPDFRLPDGVTLTTLASGAATISGTPTTVEVRSFRLRVTDASGARATQDLCIRIEQSAAGVLNAAASTVTAAEIAQLLVGSDQSILISNAVFTGSPTAIGTFTGGFAATGLSSGVILSSGAVANVNPPNNVDGVTAAFNRAGDPDLTALVEQGNSTFDAAILEFDFTVTDTNATTVKFDYVFSSDEYNEFVNQNFNDVFGFFMSGPEFPKRNLALVPNTTTPVSINNVNGGNPFGVNATNPSQFINNDLNDGGGAIGTQADGLTKVFSMSAPVTPNVTYHLKIAIADAGDFVLDSWVLIKAGSFRVVCPIIPNCPSCVGRP
jgi:hypothetical protein